MKFHAIALAPILCSGYNPPMTLDIDKALQRLIDVIPAWRGRVLRGVRVTGGMTNEIVRVDIDGEAFVVRFAGYGTEQLGIDRDEEARICERAGLAGIAPEVIGYFPEERALIARFVVGSSLQAADLFDYGRLYKIAAILQRCHALEPCRATFRPSEKIKRFLATANANNVTLPPEMPPLGPILERLERRELEAPRRTLCHNDLLPANIIEDLTGRLVLIDWEYAAMGDPLYDLANLAYNCGLDCASEQQLLDAYADGGHGNTLTDLHLLRKAAGLIEATWAFAQCGVSTLGVDFYAYGRSCLARVEHT